MYAKLSCMLETDMEITENNRSSTNINLDLKIIKVCKEK